MVRLLDTSLLEPKDRVPVFLDTFFTREVPHLVSLEGPAQTYSAVLDHWDLAPGARLFRTLDTGQRLLRSEQHLQVAAPERFAVAMKLGCPGEAAVGRQHQDLRPGDMHLVDQTSASDYSSHGIGGSQALIFDYARVGVTVDTVRTALTTLPSSPLYQLFRGHMTQLATTANKLEQDPQARAAVAVATVELVRALILTAGGPHTAARGVLHESESARVSAYIDQHVRERDLTASRIARENHMSLRQLYKVWENEPLTLAEHIVALRLRGARADLIEPRWAGSSIASIAARWGFASSAHFSRRFRAAYHMTPFEWRTSAHRG